MNEVIAGGERLREDLWHPFRAPAVHGPKSVEDLHSRVIEAWSALGPEWTGQTSDWYVIEISKVIELLVHASAAHMSVVSVLQPPFDEEQSKLIIIPIEGTSS